MKLHTYWRSSSAYRVRIGLALKDLACEQVPVHLVRDGGEQHAEAYRALNPQSLVPALELDDGTVLTQSLAILEYLDEAHPEPALLPADPAGRARVRALAQLVAADMQPLNNLRVLRHLKRGLGLDQDAVNRWYRHWVATGFTALERRLAAEEQTGAFCHGDTPGLADVVLVPQVYNAQRFDCPLDRYPVLMAIHERCVALPAFQAAAPEAQPDAEAG